MADAAISFAVERLGDALLHKVKFLKGVEDDVCWLKDELRSMKRFLNDASEKQSHDESIREWISDLRELAHDAADAIEIFTLKSTTTGLLQRYTRFLAHVSHLNRVGEEIQTIRTRLHEIKDRRDRYGFESPKEDAMEFGKHEVAEWRRRMAPRYLKEKDVVGLNQDAELLLSELMMMEETEGPFLAAIVGMGGIGKTTLAWKIYNHCDVASRFEYRAWAVVSNEFAPEHVLKQLMDQLFVPTELMNVEGILDKKERLEKLKKNLAGYLLEKHYFIVLDDVWEYVHWELLKSAFPQDKSSRLLFTSRIEIISESHGYIHKMKVLIQDESWELLLKTAFIGRSDVVCPPELEDIGRQILKKCNGLPLAITVAGGLLVNYGKSKRGWERVLKQMKDYHLETSEIGCTVSAILELSYHNLPSQLKPCFLCLAFFKENAAIQVKRLVHIWVAQGFVQAVDGGEETAEERAESYLDELIKRSLVLVKDMAIDDGVKYCYLHDLVRELTVKKAKEEIGFESLPSDYRGSASSKSSSLDHKPRHRVIRGIGQRLLNISNQNKYLRSLFLHVKYANLNTDQSYWKSFRLLKILDIEGSRMERLPSRIRAMIGIKYLRLREVGKLRLPSWLDTLKNLEVLDIANCESVEFPDVKWKMDSLRHFYNDNPCIIPGSMKRYTWKNLETLKYIRSDNLLSENPIHGFSGRLRKLGVKVMSQREVAVIMRLLTKISAVEVLHLRLNNFISLNEFNLNSLNHLTKLRVRGFMSLTADMFPPNITHLTFSYNRLIAIFMGELSKLPKLLFLKLDHASDGASIKVSRDGFPRLKALHLSSMRWLESIEVEEGGMPHLQRLQICQCPFLCKSAVQNLQKLLRYTAITIID